MATEPAPVLEAAALEVCRRTTSAPRWRRLGVEAARAVVEVAPGRRRAPRLPVDVEDIGITTSSKAFQEDARRLSVRIYRPAGEPGCLPGVVYLHGAGWTFDGSVTHDHVARSLAACSRCVVLLPAVARAPEAPHPVALEQCYELLVLAAAGRLRPGIDGSRLAVVGDGTGGCIAAGLALLSRQRRGPSLDAQVLICPALDPACDTPSHRTFGTGAALSQDDVRWLWEQYVPDPAQPMEITAVPLRARVDELGGLPPALIITAEIDVLRDEGEQYASMLRASGVDVLATRYLATVHGFCHLAALQDTPAAEAVIDQVATFLRRAAYAGHRQ